MILTAAGRDELQSVFEPVLRRILRLVRGQIETVREKDNARIKVFLLSCTGLTFVDSFPGRWSRFQHVPLRLSEIESGYCGHKEARRMVPLSTFQR